MTKKCFLSFHYKTDSWRVQQVAKMGAVEEQPILDPNEWEKIKRSGDEAVKAWIEDKMKGKHCVVVLVGKETASRRWVKHEIKRGCERGLGVLGIYIHNMQDQDKKQTTKGSDPFAGVTVYGKPISSYAKIYTPAKAVSTDVYKEIAENIEAWIDEAIRLRK